MRLLALFLVLGGAGVLCADPDPATQPAVKIEKLATGFRFTEGPAVDAQGCVFFTDIPNQRIHRFDPKTSKTTLFREDSGRANGLAFDARGDLIACEGGRRQVVRIHGERVEVLARTFEGKKLNSPNDLAIDATGGIYFTDPRYGKPDGRELDYEGVFYRAPSGTLSRVATEAVRPNGILLSGDSKTLYVADSKRKLILAYDVTTPGSPTRGRVFATLDLAHRGGPDGMSRDRAGNVYCAGQGKVWIFDRTGKRVETIEMPEGPANVVCVDTPQWSLYVTARTSLYRVRRPAPDTRPEDK